MKKCYFEDKVKNMNFVEVQNKPNEYFMSVKETPKDISALLDYSEKEPQIVEVDEFTRRFSNFSSSDIIIKAGNKSIGEVCKIGYYIPSEIEKKQIINTDFYNKHYASENPIVICLYMTLFSCYENYFKNKCDIILQYANEFEDCMYREFKDCNLLNTSSTVDIYSFLIEEKLILSCKEATDFIKGFHK